MTERHTPPTSGITFPTKVDAWLLLVIAGAFVATIASVYAAYRTDPAEARVALLVIGASWALVAALCVPCYYTLAEDQLIGAHDLGLGADAIVVVKPDMLFQH